MVLILTNVPKGELITGGPYAIVKHPLYTAVALLVIPWIGFLSNTWLGAGIGIALYVGSRILRTRGGGPDVGDVRRPMGGLSSIGVDPGDLAGRREAILPSIHARSPASTEDGSGSLTDRG